MHPAISLRTIRRQTSAHLIRLGQRVVPKLQNTTRARHMLQSQCSNGRRTPYLQTIWYKGDDIRQCWCNCQDRGRCKHIAALMIRWIESPRHFRATEDPLNVVSAMANLIGHYPHLNSEEILHTLSLSKHALSRLNHLISLYIHRDQLTMAVACIGALPFDEPTFTIPTHWIPPLIPTHPTVAAECLEINIGAAIDRRNVFGYRDAIGSLHQLKALHRAHNTMAQWYDYALLLQDTLEPRSAMCRHLKEAALWVELPERSPGS